MSLPPNANEAHDLRMAYLLRTQGELILDIVQRIESAIFALEDVQLGPAAGTITRARQELLTVTRPVLQPLVEIARRQVLAKHGQPGDANRP